VIIARQVQRTGSEQLRAPAKRRAGTVAEHQEAVAVSLPGVGRVLARRLLERSGSLAALAGSDASTLRQVRGIGRQRAHALSRLLTAPYRPNDDRMQQAEGPSDKPPPGSSRPAPTAGRDS